MNVTGEVVTEMGLREACTLVFWSLGLFWVTRFEKLVWLSSGTCEIVLYLRNGKKYETWFLDLTGCRIIFYRWHEAFVRVSKLRILIDSTRGYEIGSCVFGLMSAREREWCE